MVVECKYLYHEEIEVQWWNKKRKFIFRKRMQLKFFVITVDETFKEMELYVSRLVSSRLLNQILDWKSCSPNDLAPSAGAIEFTDCISADG